MALGRSAFQCWPNCDHARGVGSGGVLTEVGRAAAQERREVGIAPAWASGARIRTTSWCCIGAALALHRHIIGSRTLAPRGHCKDIISRKPYTKTSYHCACTGTVLAVHEYRIEIGRVLHVGGVQYQCGSSLV